MKKKPHKLIGMVETFLPNLKFEKIEGQHKIVGNKMH
jgi:hypothetical protein